MAIRKGFGVAITSLTQRKLKQLARASSLPALGIGSLLPPERREGRRPAPTSNIGGA